MGARKKITWERERAADIYLLQKCTFWACSQKTFEYLFDVCRPGVVATYIDLMQEMSCAINVTWSDFFFFVKLIFFLTNFSKNILALMMNKSFSLVAWWFFGSLRRGGCYETTTTESFDGSNKTEVVGGRFFEAAAAVKACENLLGRGLGGLRRQTRVKTKNIHPKIFFLWLKFL